MDKKEELIINLKNTLATLENKIKPSELDKVLKRQLKRKIKKAKKG